MRTNATSAGAVHALTADTTRHLPLRRAGLWAGLLAFAAIAFGPQPAQPAVTEAWVQRYSNILSSTTGRAIKVVRDAAGDIIVTGSITGGLSGVDILTIKYSGADGTMLWQQRYNNPANGEDRPTGLAVDGSGNVVVTGVVGAFGEYYAYTAKYAAADGALIWEKRYWSYLATAALAVDGSGNVVVAGTSVSNSFFNTAKFAAADGALLWERLDGSSSGSEATALAVDSSGNVVVTGLSSSNNSTGYYTAKFAAADGALLWEKRYDGPANSQSNARALAVDGSGDVVVTGASSNDGTVYDFYTVKYAAADGALLWERRYNGPANDYDEARAVAVDGSGNVVVTGRSYDVNTTNPDFYTVKYAAADGALLWERRYNGPANGYDFPNAVAVDSSGNVAVTGWTDAQGPQLGFGVRGGDYYTAKYAAVDGALLWERRYNGPANGADSAAAVVVDVSGNVLVTGQSSNGSNDDFYTAKYAAADGALLWEQRYIGLAPNDASAREVAVDGSGNVVVTGSAYTFRPDGTPDADYYTAKYAAADGALLWERRYNGSTNSYDQASAVVVDLNGNVVVTGSSERDSYTVKYAAADGALLWEKHDGFGDAIAVAVDGSGNVVVTGTLRTAKYAASDGTLLWEKGYGAASGYVRPNSLAIDVSGNVVVAGPAFDFGPPVDSYTAKYAAADGALLWEKRYSDGYANAVAVDGGGNVVVTGYSWVRSGSNHDYLTVKYAAADGALLWEKRYNGPANDYDEARAVAVDGSGNVVVTGRSYDVNITNPDYYTAKYAAADGALLWEKRHKGGLGRAVALDGSGNVIVTGNSFGGIDSFGNTIFDYYTSKYAAADGALLWEKRLNGPGSVGDSPHCLALGPNGMVAVTGGSNGGYVTVVYRDLPAISIDLISTGVRFHVTGLPGRRYNIERAPALTGPWSTINTQSAPASGALEYLDTNPPAAAFYRTREP